MERLVLLVTPSVSRWSRPPSSPSSRPAVAGLPGGPRRPRGCDRRRHRGPGHRRFLAEHRACHLGLTAAVGRGSRACSRRCGTTPSGIGFDSSITDYDVRVEWGPGGMAGHKHLHVLTVLPTATTSNSSPSSTPMASEELGYFEPRPRHDFPQRPEDLGSEPAAKQSASS